MKETGIEFLVEQLRQLAHNPNTHLGMGDIRVTQGTIDELEQQAKEMEEKKLLEMLHKFGFDYAYNYKGEKTIYEWIPEWFEEYKRVQQFKNK